MKVKELIKKLREFDGDKEVLIDNADGHAYSEITTVETDDGIAEGAILIGYYALGMH